MREERSSPACLWAGHRKSSCPCSRVRGPKLPSCFFQVCAFALFLLRSTFVVDEPTVWVSLKIVSLPLGGVTGYSEGALGAITGAPIPAYASADERRRDWPSRKDSRVNPEPFRVN